MVFCGVTFVSRQREGPLVFRVSRERRDEKEESRAKREGIVRETDIRGKRDVKEERRAKRAGIVSSAYVCIRVHKWGQIKYGIVKSHERIYKI